jgi:plastocyanin
MGRFLRGHARYGVAAVVFAAILGGAAAAGMAAHAASKVTRVTVTEREYKIGLARRTFKAGKVTFVVHNSGKLAHTFDISGPGVTKKKIPGTIAPGKTRSLTVQLRGGTYKLWCSIHVAQGMKTTVKVSGATSGGTTTSGGGSGGGWG